MMNRTKLNDREQSLVNDMIKWNKGNPEFKRDQLIAAHMDLRGKKASPHFVTKNLKCKIRDRKSADGFAHGQYTLAVFLAKGDKTVKAPRALSMTKDAIRKREVAAAKRAEATN